MKTTKTWAAVGASLAVLLIPGAAALAAAAPLRQASTDPRNLEGVWFHTNPSRLNRDKTISPMRSPETEVTLPHSRVLWPIDRKEPPFNAAGQARFEASFRGAINNAPIADPSTNCEPHGVPRIMVAPYPMQIVQTPGLVTMLFEVNHNVRLVHMDQPMPASPPITAMGYSVGRWEGDTLVIETKGISGKAIMDEIGTPQSDQLKVVERIRKVNDNTALEVHFTFDDPGAYSRPWEARELMAARPDISLMEYVCEENNRNAPDASGLATAR